MSSPNTAAGTEASITSVTGGSQGLQAQYAAMRALARRYETAAADFLDMAKLGPKVMANGDLVESAVLSPVTFAEAEAQVLDATTGIHGLTVRSLGIESDALLVRATATAFETSDVLSRQLMERLDYLVGRAVGTAVIAAPGVVAVTGGAAYLWYQSLSPGEQSAFVADSRQFLHDHPALAQHLINGGGGLVDGLLGPLAPIGWLNPGDGGGGPGTTNDAARMLALIFGDDGDPVVKERSEVPWGVQETAPNSVAGLMERLGYANNLDRSDSGREHPLNGAIQIVTMGEGAQTKYVVYVPGTDDLNPVPEVDGTVRDMLTNYRLIGGLDTTYGRGIADAMAAAGLEGKDVMLVGHSQGGMVSVALAADPAFRERFHVEHVVTAGSPTAQVPDLPRGTQSLHLENQGDIVPLLDGEDNPDQQNRVTVQFDLRNPGEGGPHDLRQYADGGAAVDASTNESIKNALAAMKQDGYLGHGNTVTDVQTYTISRAAA